MTSAAEIIRASGIGSSEIALIMGVSKWGDAWTVYATKKGLIQPKAQTEEMRWGKLLEPTIAGAFSDDMNLPINWWDQRIYSERRPWQYASPDAFVFSTGDEPERVAVLECKTAGPNTARDFDPHCGTEAGLPEYYLAQIEWQLDVTGLDHAYCAVLIGGSSFRIYEIEHDPVYAEILVEHGEKFWREHLLADVPPPVSGSDEARAYLRKRYPQVKDKIRMATQREMDMLSDYAALRVHLKEMEGEKDRLEARLCDAIQEAEGIESPLYRMTWKKTKDRTVIDWEALARQQIEGYSDQEREDLVASVTYTEPGSRRIYLREK